MPKLPAEVIAARRQIAQESVENWRRAVQYAQDRCRRAEHQLRESQRRLQEGQACGWYRPALDQDVLIPDDAEE
jgi:hypothetical protein